jgi:hypothetical protein
VCVGCHGVRVAAGEQLLGRLAPAHTGDRLIHGESAADRIM